MVGATRVRPAGQRPGRGAWLGPVALGLAVASWVFPVGSLVSAGSALACAVLSAFTGREYGVDWTAVLGGLLATGNLTFSLLLTLADAQH